MIIGLDIGGSTTDAVALGDPFRVVSVETSDPVVAAAGALGRLLHDHNIPLPSLTVIAATGGGAHALGDTLLGVPVRQVPEIRAVGTGGVSLAGRTEALVVSLGTGTALVTVRGDEIQHVSGTGVGGGTLLGLSKHLIGVSRLDRIEELAAGGDLSRVDLTVGDIAGGPVGHLPAHATASNFGKLWADATPQDKARAVVNMIAEVIVVLSVTVARANGLRDVVLTGKLVRVRAFVERVMAARAYFDCDFFVPPHAEYATAVGAARLVSL